MRYDNLLRIKQEDIEGLYSKRYEYLTNKDHTTMLVKKENIGFNNIEKERYEYEYDDLLNIVKIKRNEEELVRYEYDKLSRLVREDNKELDKSIIYMLTIGNYIFIKKYKTM